MPEYENLKGNYKSLPGASCYNLRLTITFVVNVSLLLSFS